jgi:hypothetical protein
MKRFATILFTVATLFTCWMPKGFAATPTAPTEPDCDTGLSWLVEFSRRVTGHDATKIIKVGNQLFTVAQLTDAISKVYMRWEANGRLLRPFKRSYVENALKWAITERKPKDEHHEHLADDDDACGPPDGHTDTEDVLVELIDRRTHVKKGEAFALLQVACWPAVFVNVALSLKHAQVAALSHPAPKPAALAQTEPGFQGDSTVFAPIDSSVHTPYFVPLSIAPIPAIQPVLVPSLPLFAVP